MSLTDGFATDCRWFTGYKPCRFRRPCPGCPHYAPVRTEILLINLDALGDVLRTTAVLSPIYRQWPNARLTWLTRPRAVALIEDHPLVDQVIPWNVDAMASLPARRFDVLLNVDKSAVAGGLAVRLNAGERRGFGIDERGVIVPLNPEARYLYETGLDDDLKFRRNQKTEPQMLCEAFGLLYQRDHYTLHLPETLPAAGPRRAVGFNTGCSPLYPYKKLPLAIQAEAIRMLHAVLKDPILLLGGPEDEARNRSLHAELGDLVELTPTGGGLKVGASHVNRCDVVVSGDSLGMHMAVALQKHAVVWFGVTCPQEIDLYGRGVKILSDVRCAPCWKQRCKRTPKCFDQVDPSWIVEGVLSCLDARRAGRWIDDVIGADWWRPPLSGQR